MISPVVCISVYVCVFTYGYSVYRTFSCGIENILFCRMPRKRKEAQNDGPSAKKSRLPEVLTSSDVSAISSDPERTELPT